MASSGGDGSEIKERKKNNNLQLELMPDHGQAQCLYKARLYPHLAPQDTCTGILSQAPLPEISNNFASHKIYEYHYLNSSRRSKLTTPFKNKEEAWLFLSLIFRACAFWSPFRLVLQLHFPVYSRKMPVHF